MRSDSINRHPVAALSAALALAAAPLAAQARFAWPDTTVQVSEYSRVDQCLAAVQRVQRGLDRSEALTGLRDTLPHERREQLEPPPSLVRETAERCAAHFPESTAKLADFAPLLQLYLVAGRDADASALLARRVAATSAKNTRERAAVEDSAVGIYLHARPVHLDAAERILLARAQGGDRLDRLRIYAQLMSAAVGLDTARARRAAQWIVAVADSLTPAERESEKFENLGGGSGGKTVVFGAVRELTGLSVVLDSLRHSTAAMVALERNMWSRMLGERPEALPMPIGERAPTITADYWIPSAAGSVPRPTPGHVNYIMFLNDAECVHLVDGLKDVGDQCGAQLAVLRRLSQRFPALDITIVSSTHGSFVYAPPPSPAEEADMIRQWLEPYHIPRLTVAVTSTPFWNLPRPDGRRIDKPTQNYTNYSFGKGSQGYSNTFLIDQDGIVVTQDSDESDLARFIEVLLQREAAKGDHAAK